MSAQRTPRNPSYPSCEHVHVKLLIYPGALAPEAVSTTLRIQPTATQTRGETKTSSQGLPRQVKINGWFLSSEGQVESKDARDHLAWLLARIEPSAAGLRDLQNRADVVMAVDCVWWSAAGHGGPVLWPEQMRRLADLDLECGFDIYFFGDNDEDESDEGAEE